MKFPLLKPEVTELYANKILMPSGATDILKNIAQMLNEDQVLLDIYTQFYDSYIDSGHWTTVWEALNIDPYVEAQFGQHASLFYLHAALQRLPMAEKKYEEMGLDKAFFVETVRDISTWVQNAYDLVGYYCIRNFSWVWRHIEARMFRIGRMQYLLAPYIGDIKGFYNKADDQFVLLAKEGIALRTNGDMQGVCGKEHTTDGFITSYTETESSYTGHPITADGKGLTHTITLSKAKWEKVIDEGDTMLEIHIPRDQPFTLDEVTASYEQAKLFFAQHFPDINYKGMMCQSWLFTPQIKEMLPETSNVVQFQKQFYLYPTAGSVRSIWFFVFNELLEVKDAKPDTTLRRKILEFIEQDKEIFDMRCVFYKGYGKFGQTVYTPIEQLILS